jgi:hypothetical protein
LKDEDNVQALNLKLQQLLQKYDVINNEIMMEEEKNKNLLCIDT